MAKQYQVTAPCIVHVPVSTGTGTALSTFYKDAMLPSDVPAERIKQLLDSGLIAEVGAAPATPAEPEQPSATVNARSSKGDLVEHGVSQGGDRAELEALTREELLNRYVRQQS